MNRINFLLARMNPMMYIDGYKLGHHRQYPDNTEYVNSNVTPRSSRVIGCDGVVFFGLQAFIQEYLVERMNKYFFGRPKDEVLHEFETFVQSYLGPNNVGTEHIAELWDLQYLPIEIRAIDEGSYCPLRVPCLIIENTNPRFGWLVNYLETLISASLWQPCTSATLAYEFRKLLNQAADETCENRDLVQWQGHDFSFRGMSSVCSAETSGAAHLLSFTGTDTIPAILYAEAFYPGENGLVGGSVAATEHSVMCAGGQGNELETISRLLDIYPEGILSVVSDTWDLWNVITVILPQLRSKIVNRKGKLVIRPDSGDPVKIICGDPNAQGPARKGVVELLWDIFGGRKNSKGYKELAPCIGAIYGDSINYERAKAILNGLKAKGFASNNIVLGIGSFTYQYNTRDTFGFAIKATNVVINGVSTPIFKKPITDDGVKNSACGYLRVDRGENNRLQLRENVSWEEMNNSPVMTTVWKDGNWVKRHSFSQVRETLSKQG